jgi:hypothetical protein
VVLDTTGHHLLVFLQGAESGFLICAHEAAVTLDIRTEDGRELTLNLICGHGIISLRVYNGNGGYNYSGNLGFGIVSEPSQG